MGRFNDWTWGCGGCYNLKGSGVGRSHEGRKSAVTFVGSDAIRSLERRSVKFCVSFWGVVSRKGVASSLVRRVSLPSSSSVSVLVPGGWSRGRRLPVQGSIPKFCKPPWRACPQCVRCSVDCNSMQPVSSQLEDLCVVQ